MAIHKLNWKSISLSPHQTPPPPSLPSFQPRCIFQQLCPPFPSRYCNVFLTSFWFWISQYLTYIWISFEGEKKNAILKRSARLNHSTIDLNFSWRYFFRQRDGEWRRTTMKNTCSGENFQGVRVHQISCQKKTKFTVRDSVNAFYVYLYWKSGDLVRCHRFLTDTHTHNRI